MAIAAREAGYTKACWYRMPTQAKRRWSAISKSFRSRRSARRSAFLQACWISNRTLLNSRSCSREFSRYDLDFADVRGQEVAKRALTIAAAGSHNLLLARPALARRCWRNACRRSCRTLDSRGVDRNNSHLQFAGAIARRSTAHGDSPFPWSHHTISNAGLVGGGSPPAPGGLVWLIMGCCFWTSCRSLIDALWK